MCGVATVNGIGPRESSVSRFRRVRLLRSFRIAPAACPLARSPVLQYVHSIRLCLDVNRVERAIFNTVLTPPPNAGVGSPGAGSAPKQAWIVAAPAPARAVQAAASERPQPRARK